MSAAGGPDGRAGREPGGTPEAAAAGDGGRVADAGKERCWRCGAARRIGTPCERCGNAEPAPARRPAPVRALVKGLAGPARGLAFVAGHPRLWSWIVAPLVVNTILFGLVLWWIVTHLGAVLPDLSTTWPAWIDWLRAAVGWLLEGVLWVVGVLAGFLVTLMLSGIINAPFYDLLSEAVENAWLGRKDPGRPWSLFLGDLVRSLAASLSLVARQVLVMGLLFLLSFTAVGAPLFMLAGFYYAGLAQVDVVLARKLYPGGGRARWGRRHALLLVGLGTLVGLLPLLLPFGLVGATLAYLEEPDKA